MEHFYRGVIGHPIVFPESVLITPENLNSIDFDKVIYCEISPMGAMGNEGGILIYLLGDKDTLLTYETNESIDKETYSATSERINQNVNLFISYSGGMGNHVYVKKDAQLEIDEKYNCFWYHSPDTKLRINSSVKGVFLGVVSGMTRYKSKILLHIDDDKFLLDMYGIKFKQLGFEVISMEKLEPHTIEHVLELKPDIIVSDHVRPHPDGLELLEMIKADERTKGISFVFLTNTPTDNLIKRSKELGANAVIVKAAAQPDEVAQEIGKLASETK